MVLTTIVRWYRRGVVVLGLTHQDVELFERMALELRRVAAELRGRQTLPVPSDHLPVVRLEEYASAIVRDLRISAS